MLPAPERIRHSAWMWICGVDEAGRGPLAGPVVAAAVVLPPRGRPAGLTDSKLLTADQREELAVALRACAWFGLGEASVAEIDALNIHHANHLAMQRAFAALSAAMGEAPVAALVDGRDRPALPCAVEAIVAGDAHVPSISAASILAKTHRDAVMKALESSFPGYGFAQHKGYGTPLHLAALRALGPCAAHRRSFKPVAEQLAHTRAA